MTGDPATIRLSLLSHTNVGKTTLARTLLRRDIGEVGDRPHVTELAESHVLIESAQGDKLLLWDTPGFGDSARLLKRLKQSGNPLGWALSQVWDRFTDRPFWCSQQAMRTARDDSDVVLYVANAAEVPGSAGYVDVEMQILGWIGKPIVLLLNQLGPPRSAEQTQTELDQWRTHLASFPLVRNVLLFDAFARCWMQESTLLEQVQPLLPPELQPPFERLREAWRQRNLEVFDQSMRALAKQLAVTALDREQLSELNVQQKARAWIGAVASGDETGEPDVDRAQTSLAQRLDAQVRSATEELVRLHGLTGRATEEVLKRMGHQISVNRPPDADKAGVLGGLLSGALSGLAADVAAGGLTFGAGAIIGGLLGAVGARELTRAYNLARGSDTGTVRWSGDFLRERAAAAVVRYLAVAHFGRGRGEFVSGAVPAFWQEAVATEVEAHRLQLDRAWRVAAEAGGAESVEQQLLPVVTNITKNVLIRLYPDCAPVFG
jgi:GTPase SAR1 family protein